MSTRFRSIVVPAATVALWCASSAWADVVVYPQASHPNHRTVEGPGGSTQNFSFGLLAGGGGGQNGFAGIAYFELPEVLTADNLAEAHLQFTHSALGNNVLGNLDIWGLGYVAGAPSTTVPGSWYFDQDNDTRTGNDLGTNIGTAAVTKIADNKLPASSTLTTPLTHDTTVAEDQTLITFVRSVYDAGAVAGDHVVVRFNVDDYVQHSGNQNRYNIGSATSGPTPPSEVPVLTLTTDNPRLIDNAGITAIASTEWTATTPNRLAIQAVDGSGLSGPLLKGASHNNSPQNVWLSNQSLPVADQWIRVDLGDVYVLDAVKIWNDSHPNRGVLQADIYTAIDAFNSAGDPGNPDDNPANWLLQFPDRQFLPYNSVSEDILDLSGITARYFAIAIDTNTGGDSLVGLGELQFFGTLVPEPSALFLAATGLLGLAFLGRRKRRSRN